MELIVIDENRIKVMLDKEESRRYRISESTPEREVPSALIELCRKADFSTEGCRVLLQIFRSRDGGAEVFIERVPQKSHSEGVEETARLTDRYFVLDSPGALVGLSRASAEIGQTKRASAYICDDGRCLICSPEPPECIFEFAFELMPEAAGLYLAEHAELLRENDSLAFFSRF